MYIYCATSPSGKRYVGQTTRTVETRWREHARDAATADRCKALNNAIRKYGAGAFAVRAIVCCLPWLLDEFEEEMIRRLNTTVPHGYNIKLGGSAGKHHPDTVAKIRAKLLGKRYSRDTLVARGLAKKREKSLPMHVSGWYRGGTLVGVRAGTRGALAERRFSLSRHGSLEACAAAALEYIGGRSTTAGLGEQSSTGGASLTWTGSTPWRPRP